MSVKCICINDANRPKEIPSNKWLEVGREYEIIYTCKCLPQRTIGCHLAEIELTEKEKPYEYFLLNRFAFTEENLLKLSELIKNCTKLEFSLDELLEQTQLEEA